ncbi:MAG: hypothetical protein ACI8XO_001121 [Verrucomicrobiales bacterium]|jgi:hypothetical protein
MHPSFPLHDPDSAPGAAVLMLAQVEKSFGTIPNLERTMATAPALLEAYGTLWDLFDCTSFSPTERQIVYQTINVEHRCTY